MKQIKCPLCGNEDVEVLLNNQMKCKKCESIFYIPEKETEVEGGND